MTTVKMRVTITKDVEVQLHPAYDDMAFRENEVQEFSDSIYKVTSFDEILKHVAYNAVILDTDMFVEGFGRIVNYYDAAKLKEPFCYNGACAAVTCETIDVETDFL